MIFSNPPTRKQREIRRAPESYRRSADKKFKILAGNPHHKEEDPYPFTLVFVSCRRSVAGQVDSQLTALTANNPFLSVHHVPWAHDTYAIIRGSMPCRTPWIWERVIYPLKETSSQQQNDVDLVILELSPFLLRWFLVDPNGNGGMHVEEADNPERASELMDSLRGTLVGDDDTESDLVYVLASGAKNYAQIKSLRAELAAEENIRDVFQVNRGADLRHKDANSEGPIESPWLDDALFRHKDMFNGVQVVAVADITDQGACLQRMYNWRKAFQTQHPSIDIELMPAVTRHEGVEFMDPAQRQAEMFLATTNGPWPDRKGQYH